PAELLAARDAIDAAVSQRVAFLLPVTMERAATAYDLAYDAHQQSLDMRLGTPERAALRTQTVSHAVRARHLASEAIDLGMQIALWDESVEDYARFKDQDQMLAAVKTE